MGILSTIFLVCALRTNLVFVGIFASLQICFYLLAAAFWVLAYVDPAKANLANTLVKVCPTPIPS